MKKRLLYTFLIFILFLLNVRAQDTTVVHPTAFSTVDQSLWGPGTSSYLINLNQTLFNFGWNKGGSYGGISTVAGYRFGATINASTWGDFGAGLAIEVGTEKVDVRYTGDMALDMPPAGGFNKGQEVTINTGFTPVDTGCYISPDNYDFLLKLWLKAGLGAHLNGQACFFSCTNYSLINIEMPTQIFNLLEFSNTGVAFFDSTIYIPNGTLFYETSLSYSDPEDIFTLDITLPSNADTTISMVGNDLYSVSEPFEYVKLQFDIPKFIGALNIPYVSAFFGNLSNSYNLGPLELWYTIMRSGFDVTLYHNQKLSFKPKLYAQMKFPAIIDYKVLNASNAILSQGSDSIVNCQLGQKIKFRYPCNYDFMDVSAKYSLTNQFTNHSYDSVALNFYLEMLGFGINLPAIVVIPQICVPIYEPCGPWYCYVCDWCYCCQFCVPALIFNGFDYTYGPLVTYHPNLYNVNYDWMNRTWPLAGFNTVQAAPFRLKPAKYLVAATAKSIPCYGQNNGSVVATVTNGTPPYRYEYSNGTVHTSSSTIDSVVNLGPGTHYVIVTDINGCAVFTDVIVNQPQAALATAATVVDVDCFGSATGSIGISTAGGSVPYSFLWNGGQTDAQISNLVSGSYTVTITDVNGCTSGQNITIQQPALMSVTPAYTAAGCYGDSTGQAAVAVSGGVSPYSYSWSTGSSLPGINTLTAGIYTVTVMDAHACADTQSITIAQPAQAVSLNIASQDVLCFGGASGAIQITPAGGSAPYSTAWYNAAGLVLNQNTTELDSIVSGSYTAIITDINGCRVDTTIAIVQPPQLVWNFTTVDNLCFGESNGSIDLLVSGGTSPYHYTWSGGYSGNLITALPAGNYSVTITDTNGCEMHSGVSIAQPATAVVASVMPLNILCYGNATGAADLAPVGGTPPYSYLWSDGASTEDLSGLVAGPYTVTVTDNNGCVAYSGTVIKQPLDSLRVDLTLTHATCHGVNDGSILVQASGGTTPYYIRWDNTDFLISNNGHLLNELPAGTYQLIVTDANGCQKVETIVITSPNALQLEATATIIPCFGGAGGSINLTLTGGTLPYQILWSNGFTSEDLTGLTAGVYTVTVTDANGCAAEQSYEVTSMPEMFVSARVVPISCIDNADGSLFVTVTGGAGNYTYLWSDGSILNGIQNLASGNYSLYVMDANGCSSSNEFYVPGSEWECISIPTSFTPNGDGKNDSWVVRNIDLYPGNNVKIFNRWGNLLYEASPYSPAWDGTFNGSPVPAETYYYIINLNNGTEPFTGTVTIVR